MLAAADVTAPNHFNQFERVRQKRALSTSVVAGGPVDYPTECASRCARVGLLCVGFNLITEGAATAPRRCELVQTPPIYYSASVESDYYELKKDGEITLWWMFA